MLQDIRDSSRLLRREPGSTLAAVLLMALGIAATTTMFSVAYGVLVRPLPWADSEHLVRLEERRGDRPGRLPWTISNATYHALRENAATILGLGGWGRATVTVTGAGNRERVVAASVTPSLFRSVVPGRPFVGRLLEDDDVSFGTATNGALVSFGFWQQRLGGRNEAIGRVVGVNGRPHRIVGVMPPGFVFPDSEVQLWPGLQVIPLSSPDGMRVMLVNALARLRPGVTAAHVGAEATARGRSAPDIGSAALALFGSNGAVTVTARPALDVAVADVRPVLLILLAAIALLFATATASVVSVQVARAAQRRREIAVRSALGASSARLARQSLVESGLISMAGGACAVALTAALHRALPAVLPSDFPRLDELGIDWRLLSFAGVISAVAAVASAVVPLVTSIQVNLVEALSGDAAAPAGSAVRTRSTRLRLVIIGVQVSVACVLLVGGSLLARSFVSLIRADRGYDSANLLTAGLAFPRQLPPARRIEIAEQLEQRLRAVPGVRHVAFGLGIVFGRRIPSPRDPATPIEIEGYLHNVSPDYLSAVGARVISGRPLNRGDSAAAPPSIVVDRSFAARYLGANPLGQVLRLNLYNHPAWQVVGVVEDMEGGGVGVSSDPFARTREPRLCISYRQSGGTLSAAIFAIRFEHHAELIASALRGMLREQDTSLAFDSMSTMDEQIMTSLGRPKAYVLLIGGFALFAAAIAGVGLFGVLSYMTSQRTREIGIRMALGATSQDVVRLVARQGMMPTVGGLLAGLVTAYLAAESLSKMLYGVTAHDALSFAVVPLVLMLVAAVACIVPARRAARIEPLRALRVD
jgi:predicted permease